MDKNTDQIAAEAALDFINKWWPDCPKTLQPELQRAFQSAIEKATEELANKIQWAKTDSYTEGYNKALGEWLRGENPSRAAHASERLTDGDLEIAVDDICGEVVALTKSRKVDNLRNQIRAVLKNWWKLANTLQPAHESERWAIEDHSSENGGAFVCNSNNKPLFWCSKVGEAKKAIAAHNATPTPATASKENQKALAALKACEFTLVSIEATGAARVPLTLDTVRAAIKALSQRPTPATDCTCHADAYCKIHGNTPATASEQSNRDIERWASVIDADLQNLSHPFRDRRIDVIRSALTRILAATPATASEELHRKACEALWDGKPAHASEQGADDKAALAERLFKAWAKYEQFFQEPPHGTLKQLRAMLELMPPSQRPTPSTEGKEI